MMQLGLSASVKANDNGFAFNRDAKVEAAGKNDSSAKDFARALGQEQSSTDESSKLSLKDTDHNADSEHEPLEGDASTFNDMSTAEVDDTLIARGGDVVSYKASDNKVLDYDRDDNSDLIDFKDQIIVTTKQNIFVNFNAALDEKLAFSKTIQPKGETVDGLTVDIDGAKKGEATLTENMVSIKNKLLDKLNSETGKSVVVNEKTQVVKGGMQESKNVPSFEKRFGGTDTTTTTTTAAKANDSNASVVRLADQDTTFKTNVEKGAIKFKNRASENSNFNAVKVTVKPTSNQVSFIGESRIENLGNALQHIVTTTETKFGTTIETVSAPRSVVNANQSVVPLKTIEIQLLPKALGLIQVKIEMAEGKLTLVIEAQTAKAEAAIKQESTQIIEAIKAAGMSVEELSIRRNSELNQQDHAIRDLATEADQQQNLAKESGFNEQFSDQKEANKTLDQDTLELENDALSVQSDSRSGVYL